MIWEPTSDFIEQTNVWRFMQRLGFGDLQAFLGFSREEPALIHEPVERGAEALRA